MLPLAVSDEPQVLYLSGFLPEGLPAGEKRAEVEVPSFSAPVTRVAVRVLLPESVEASLVEAAKEGWVLEVPISPAWESWPRLAQELFGPARRSLERYALAEDLLPVPAGYRALEAAWSALSPEPSPLVVVLDPERMRKEWF